ncbi:MAG: glycosyltransferase family 1 protein [Methylobacteriaceae bacterium]|nr:glycosyltransferase family 1 protein [Methylobacteriaceae bacterium]MBV9245630.1 glycosyltransferase family 1 protein [Methylobacteriaceae bacterium]MBV9633889.1 glycosyltransferase family 1 protein [Methylobacteriaceae bacterium]
MRILVATDAWLPQVNGVVHTLQATAAAARPLGAEVHFLTPAGFRSFGLPTYRDIRLAIAPAAAVAQRIEEIAPDHIHIATEGPLGFAARRYCRRLGRPFTTSYHTRFPEYVSARAPVPERLTYALLRWFHSASIGTMVAAPSVIADLERRGFRKLMRWSRGVDHERFHPRAASILDFPRPIFLYVGRVAIEKNIEAFLRLDLPGTKVVVGDGPARPALEAAYPLSRFLGMQVGETLAQIYSSADVFVFPSRTDTFGNVLLEALASGLPVAAFPVAGPLDVLDRSGAGVLDEDLGQACMGALAISRDVALAHAATFTWEASARQFIENIKGFRAVAGTSEK